MSAEVIELRKKSAPTSKPAGLRYHCFRCDSDKFHAHTNGTLTCAKCAALISNLHIHDGAAK